MINPIYEISSTNYLDDKFAINNALSAMAAQCGLTNEFGFGEPTSRFGWTFFKLLIKPDLQMKIEQKFGDMIKKSKGTKFEEKFVNFLSDYFQSKGCKVKVKLLDS